jgi:hypothetical protein
MGKIEEINLLISNEFTPVILPNSTTEKLDMRGGNFVISQKQTGEVT